MRIFGVVLYGDRGGGGGRYGGGGYSELEILKTKISRDTSKSKYFELWLDRDRGGGGDRGYGGGGGGGRYALETCIKNRKIENLLCRRKSYEKSENPLLQSLRT